MFSCKPLRILAYPQGCAYPRWRNAILRDGLRERSADKVAPCNDVTFHVVRAIFKIDTPVRVPHELTDLTLPARDRRKPAALHLRAREPVTTSLANVTYYYCCCYEYFVTSIRVFTVCVRIRFLSRANENPPAFDFIDGKIIKSRKVFARDRTPLALLLATRVEENSS